MSKKTLDDYVLQLIVAQPERTTGGMPAARSICADASKLARAVCEKIGHSGDELATHICIRCGYNSTKENDRGA